MNDKEVQHAIAVMSATLVKMAESLERIEKSIENIPQFRTLNDGSVLVKVRQ